MQLCEQKTELVERTAEIAKHMAVPDKVPQDIVNEILEQDFKYKKLYPIELFDEKKKKTNVVWIDLLMFLHKVARESKILTFSSPRLQKYIYKLHRYLKQYLPNYQKLVSNLTFEIQQRTDLSATFIPEGSFLVRSEHIIENKEFRFLYILGPVKNEDLTFKGNKEDAEKLLLKQEKDTLYGTIYINENELTALQQDALSLKSRMIESDKQSKSVRDRNYLYHQADYEKILEQFGKFFQIKEKSKSKEKIIKDENEQQQQQQQGEQLNSVFEKYFIFLPQLSERSDQIEILIRLFSEMGLEGKECNNVLLLFRHFHRFKYK